MHERETFQVRLGGLTHVKVEAHGIREAVDFANEHHDVGIELEEHDLKNVTENGPVEGD